MQYIRRIKEYILPSSILFRLLISYVLAVLLPYLLISGFTFRIDREHQIQETAEQMLTSLRQAGNHIELCIKLAENQTSQVAQGEKLQRLLSKTAIHDAEWTISYEEIYQNIATLSYGTGKILNNFFVTVDSSQWPEKWTIFYRSETLGIEFLMPFGSAESSAKYYIGELVKLSPRQASTSEKAIYIGTPVFSVRGDKIATVYAEILEKMLTGSFAQEMCFCLLTQADTEPLFASQDFPLQQLQLPAPDGFTISNQHLFVRTDLDSIGLSLVAVMNPASASAATFYSRTGLLLLTLETVLLFVISWVVLRSVFVRLRVIMRTINIISNGNFDIRFETESKDEIGWLSQNINFLLTQISHLVHENKETEARKSQAQLSALQFQINPHFIYNTLDFFQMHLELAGEHELAEGLIDFCDILRYNIQGDMFASLADEIAIAKKYLYLHFMRKPYQYQMRVCVDESLLNCRMLRFILQPIVENSLRHGLIEERCRPFMLVIEAHQECDWLHCSVTDNGCGISEELLEEIRQKLKRTDITSQNGIGLYNINKRLILYYGEESSLRIRSRFGCYTRVEFNIRL